MNLRPAILCAIVTALTAGIDVAQAGLTLTLSSASEYGNPAADTVFSGTLTNTSGTDKLFLNDVQVSLSGASATQLTLNSNTFFGNVPGILLPGESYSGPLFSIGLNAAAPVADYPGSITLAGGADMQGSTALGNASFTVRYAPAELWRYQKFGRMAGDALAADTADWDHDGLFNLIEYGLNTEPLSPTSGTPFQALLLNDHPAFRYVPNAAATDLTFGVESSLNLIDWSSADVELLSLPNPDPPGSVTWRYVPTFNPGTPVFLHLKLTR